MKKQRKSYLDLAKIIAMLLVSYGHLVTVTSYAKKVSGVINGEFEAPLCPVTEHGLWKFGDFVNSTFGVQTSIVGVIVFFMVAGYFIPDMQMKYGGDDKSLSGLYIHCMMRIWPTLVISVAVNGALAWGLQGIKSEPIRYLATMSGMPWAFRQSSIWGWTWFLNTLVLAYILFSVIRRIELKDIPAVYVFLLFVVVMPVVAKQTSVIGFLNSMAYYARFITIIVIGIYAKLSEKMHVLARNSLSELKGI